MMHAETIARALKGRRSGCNWIARCPAHEDRTPSLSIAQAEDRVLVHCHAGCSQDAVIDKLKDLGLWSGGLRRTKAISKPQPSPALVEDDKARMRQIALRLWSETQPIGGTLGERYFLDHRKLDIRQVDLAHVLRWHADIVAVIALMTDPITVEPIGIHRTFLDDNGAKLDRKMLGRQGVVRLSRDDDVTRGLAITEGVEDGLAVSLSGWCPVWAVTSAGAMARLPVLGGIEALTIFADADGPGIQAAQTCAAQWRSKDVDVYIASPGGLYE